MVDHLFIISVFVLVVLYLYLLFYNEVSEKNKVNKRESVVFEILILSVLFIVIICLYIQKQYILLVVPVIVLLEHVNQIIFCYRQNSFGLHLITIFFGVIFILYASYKKCYWVIPIFTISILIHIISIYYHKSFSELVCIN